MAGHGHSKSNVDVHELDQLLLNGSQDGQLDTIAKDKQENSLLAWRWEVTMLLVPLIASVALLIVLAVEDRNEYRRWGPLTLNAVNTILTTVTVSSMTAFIG